MEDETQDPPESVLEMTIRDFLPKEVERWLHMEIIKFEQKVLSCNEA